MDLTGLAWRKASRSTDNGGYCVEVAVWRKARRSTDNGGMCVELAARPGGIAVRDSKNPAGPVLRVSPRAWEAFTQALKNGRYDL